MRFEDIELALPNGFHDCAIHSVDANFTARGAEIRLDLHVGRPADNDPERLRTAVLRLSGLCLFFLEPPSAGYPFVPSGRPLNADGDIVRPGTCPAVDRLRDDVPSSATLYRFFLEEWNSFLYLGAESADLAWSG